MDPAGDVALQYAEFATQAADAPTFVDWSRRVVDDPEVLAWIDALPGLKKQPNLVFAAARWHGVAAPGPYSALRAALLGDDGSLRATILSRSTQTNEVGRLATLLPAFARVAEESGGPLALLEVGPSAGLCLYPDRWSYAWPPRGALSGPGPELTCVVAGDLPVPTRLPEVAWRGGVDLNPLDVGDDDTVAWLRTLVWPGQDDRLARLSRGIEVARADPPDLRRGDLLVDLPDLVEEASAHGTVVVFHSAVVAYLDHPDRRRFDLLVRDLVAAGRCRWVSNEGKGVLPSVTDSGPPVPADLPTFVLGLDGQALAWTHGHGREMTWL